MPETLAQHNTVTQPGASPLHAESIKNTGSILGEAKSEFARVGFMKPEEFDAQIPERTEAIEAHQHTSINMSAESLDRMLSNGSHESAWSQLREVGLENMGEGNTAQGKNFHEGYFEHRAAVETQLADYVEEPGNGEPIYAAVASNEDEHLYGACPQYGDVAVILDEEAVNPNSTVYAWSDSLVSSLGRNEQGEVSIAKPQVLTKGDAMVAKAVVDMSTEYNSRFSRLDRAGSVVSLNGPEDRDKLLSLSGGYIETVLFQDVTPDMIQAVSVAGDLDNMAKAVNAIKGHPEIAEKAIFVTQDGQSELVKDFLATNFTAVKKTHGSEAVEQHVVDPDRWADLGVDASANPSTIKQALVVKAQELLQSRSELSRLAVWSRAGARMDTAQGMKQVLNSVRSNITESPSQEQLRQQYKEALRVQEALRFFEAIAPDISVNNIKETTNVQDQLGTKAPETTTETANVVAEAQPNTTEYAAENIEKLEATGEVGHFLAGVYKAALEENPQLASVKVVVSGKNKDATLGKTGGYARHKDINPDGEYSITVNTEDGFSHYDELLRSRRSAAEASARKMGIDPTEMDAKTLAGFIFTHELGHIGDYMKNAPTRQLKDERRKRDLVTLPVPGLDPTQLATYLEREDGQTYFANNREGLAGKGITTVEDLMKAQEVGYRNLKTEDIPDQFAAKVMAKVRIAEAEAIAGNPDLAAKHVATIRSKIDELQKSIETVQVPK